MANFHRVVFALVLLLASWLPTTSQAESMPATSVTNPTVLKWPMSFNTGADAGKTRVYSTAVLACQAGLINYGASMSSYVTTNVNGTSASCVYGPPALPYQGSWGTTVAANSCAPAGGLTTDPCMTYSCPAGQNWTLSGNQCTRPDCPAGAVRDPVTGTCNVNYCLASKDKPAGTYSGSGGTGAKSLCNMQAPSGDPAQPGCLIEGFANVAFNDPPNQTWSAAMKYTGGKCAAAAGNPDAGPPPLVGCPPGQLTGMVNGEPYCYKPGPTTPKTTTAGNSSNTNNPDGSSTNTNRQQTTTCTPTTCSTVTNTTIINTSSSGVSGSPVTTTTTTTCVRGAAGCQTAASVPPPEVTTSTTTGSTTTGPTTTTGNTSTTPTTTTSTTVTTGGGGGGSGSGGGNGEGDEDGSLFSGECGKPPVCDGDAVLCAVAAATFATNCVLKNPNTPTPLYDAAITKTGDQTGTNPNNSTVNISSSSFDQTELLGGASGMADRSITVMGSVIVIPFSSVNIWLQRLGVILQACTFLLCARIVVRG